MNPIDFKTQDFKTMNNDILIAALQSFQIKAVASGRNDLHVNDRKVSGSAYKLKLGKSDGSGRRALHHGTMLLDLKLDALQKYLNPNKKKLASKGVDSVVSRVLNLKEIAPDITHDNFCDALERAFTDKWQQNKEKVKKTRLDVSEMKKIPKLMEIYDGYSKWEWRFGETPDFKH